MPIKAGDVLGAGIAPTADDGSQIMAHGPLTITEAPASDREDETYVCAACGETFEKVWSDDEAWHEAKTLFGDHALTSPMTVVCDDCWKKIMAV